MSKNRYVRNTRSAFQALSVVIGICGGWFVSVALGLTIIFFVPPVLMVVVGLLAKGPVNRVSENYIDETTWPMFAISLAIIYGTLLLWWYF